MTLLAAQASQSICPALLRLAPVQLDKHILCQLSKKQNFNQTINTLDVAYGKRLAAPKSDCKISRHVHPTTRFPISVAHEAQTGEWRVAPHAIPISSGWHLAGGTGRGLRGTPPLNRRIDQLMPAGKPAIAHRRKVSGLRRRGGSPPAQPSRADGASAYWNDL